MKFEVKSEKLPFSLKTYILTSITAILMMICVHSLIKQSIFTEVVHLLQIVNLSAPRG